MIKLITGLLLAIALTITPVVAVITIPDGATPVDGGPIQECGDTLVLKYIYVLPDGGAYVIIKEPNHTPRLSLRWKEAPGEGGHPFEVLDRDEKITLDELMERYPNGVCDLFKKA